MVVLKFEGQERVWYTMAVCRKVSGYVADKGVNTGRVDRLSACGKPKPGKIM